MYFKKVTARSDCDTAERELEAGFPGFLFNSSDAVFDNMAGRRIIGATGLPFKAPICSRLLNNGTVAGFVCDTEGDILFIFDKDSVRLSDGEGNHIDAPEAVLREACRELDGIVRSAGSLDGEGCHIVDLLSDRIGTHYDVNLLIGNRVGYPDPLITTPKGAVDSLGRGSFRATAARQVTSTRYNLIPEQNGEPCNRQFYLVENGRQIFYSADVHENVKSGYCRHGVNNTEISYITGCGLEITRRIFILPQEDGMPDAVEAQRVEIRNLTGEDRRIKIVFTGMFGLATPESVLNDTIYASVTWESGLIYDGDKPVAVSPNPFPGYLKPYRRFALMTAEGAFLEEYCANYADFIGNGTLEKPQNVIHLKNGHARKTAPFFAMAKTLFLRGNGTAEADEFTGMTIDKEGVRADEALFRLVEKYKNPENTKAALGKVKDFSRKYESFLKVETGDERFDAYVSHNLPFQVYYQSYVSRSFAWTQKSNREIGFREIQDMLASLYYIIGMGDNALAKEMLACWVKNVYEMGYANHNFYETGKEPGICSDDGLWLVQAVYRYVSLTGDTEFLYGKYPIAGADKERTVLDTLLAVVSYSGKISTGAHGLPLLDRADWNDCLKLDDDWCDGKEKEKRYYSQLEKSGEKYGARFKSDYSESVMNAFLLKIAYDDIASLALMCRDSELAGRMSADSAELAERIRKCAWKGDFYARALVGGKRTGGYTYLGAAGDGLSLDGETDGTYFLNSFSWSLLAGVADEEQIEIMLDRVNKYLVTPFGLKLCTPCNLGALASGTSASVYFPGDRENGGVFKHAAMMAATACLNSAKTVKSQSLAVRLASLAFFALDSVYPYKTLEHPFGTKGNPRFCTQYNNSATGENIGPMLSGTASWLSLALLSMFGIDIDCGIIDFSPVLREEMTHVELKLEIAGSTISVIINKGEGFRRAGEATRFALDGKPFSGRMAIPGDNTCHSVIIDMR